jgi:hypothetical protein
MGYGEQLLSSQFARDVDGARGEAQALRQLVRTGFTEVGPEAKT